MNESVWIERGADSLLRIVSAICCEENVCVLWRLAQSFQKVTWHQAYIRAKICNIKRNVMPRDHQPCLRMARLKHHLLNMLVGRVGGRLDGFCLLKSFWRSIHSLWGLVKKADPVFELKLPMMILGKCNESFDLKGVILEIFHTWRRASKWQPLPWDYRSGRIVH